MIKAGHEEAIMREDLGKLQHPRNCCHYPRRRAIHLGRIAWQEMAFLMAAIVIIAYLFRETDQGVNNRARQTVTEHGGPVRSIVFRPDGAMLLSVGGDGLTMLWELAGSQKYPFLVGKLGQVYSATFSPDSKTLATLALSGGVIVHDLTTHRLRTLYDPHTAAERALCLAFAPDSMTLAIGHHDGRIGLWDVGTGKTHQVLDSDTGFIASLAFSPDRTTLAFSSGNRTVRFWNLSDNRERLLFHDQAHAVSVLAFSPDGRLLIMGNYISPTIRVWNIATGREQMIIQGLTGNLIAVAISHNSHTLAAADYNGLITFWDLQTLKIVPRRLRHDGLRSLAFAPDGHTLATGGFDGTIQLWDWPQCVITDDTKPIATSVLPVSSTRVSGTTVQLGTSEANRPAASVQAAVSRGS
jgi:WD40 repeat protein